VRVLAYFAMVFVFTMLFRELPLVGGLFRVPLFGFFLTAALMSTVGARAATWLSQQRALSRDLSDLGVVDTPHMRGKLGRLLVMNGRPKAALEPLREAVAADSENLEFHYRLGVAERLTGNPKDSIRLLTRVTELDDRYAYGEPWMQLALAHQDDGDNEAAVRVLERLEVLQGPTGEQTFRLGCLLKALGRKDEAGAVFDRLPEILKRAAKYQKAEIRGYLARSYFARL
jgi:tetratricopeptide (TPR) repeat protein